MRQPELTAEEWDHLLRRLESERRNLVSMIHHAGSSSDREELRKQHDDLIHLVSKINAALKRDEAGPTTA